MQNRIKLISKSVLIPLKHEYLNWKTYNLVEITKFNLEMIFVFIVFFKLKRKDIFSLTFLIYIISKYTSILLLLPPKNWLIEP